MNNNPTIYSDPRGDEGQECCGGIIDAVNSVTRKASMFIGGVANAWGSNQLGGAGRVDVNTMSGLTDNDKMYANAGMVLGDAASIITGAGEIGGGAAGELASVGAATPVALAVGAHGVSSLSLGASNLFKDFFQVNASSTSSSSQSSSSPPSSASGSNVPNPNGKGGSQEHKDVVYHMTEFLKSQGFDLFKPEAYIKVPAGGNKASRFVDLQATNSSTGEVRWIQVGVQNKGGTPVAREQKAIDDLNRVSGANVFFQAYKIRK